MTKLIVFTVAAITGITCACLSLGSNLLPIVFPLISKSATATWSILQAHNTSFQCGIPVVTVWFFYSLLRPVLMRRFAPRVARSISKRALRQLKQDRCRIEF